MSTTDNEPRKYERTETVSVVASIAPWRLIWRRFAQHRLALFGLVVVMLIYLVVILGEFFAPMSPDKFDGNFAYAPPQPLHFRVSIDGQNTLGIFAQQYVASMDPETFEISYELIDDAFVRLGFFVRGFEYRLLGLFWTDRHFFGPIDPDTRVYLLGTDRLGRDLLSRMVMGTRVSMTIGLVGVGIALSLGLLLGGISGYFGGVTDGVIQRIVEFFMSIPSIPLWLGLAAAMPQNWGAMERYFVITVILAVISWTDLARVVRGRFLSLRTEQYVEAARLDGASAPNLIGRHMMPALNSHLIASITLSIPAMILAETALSFLGLGLQAPVISWGVLLQEAQNVRVIATAPWLMIPGLMVTIVVLALNFVGDGLRDAADPFA